MFTNTFLPHLGGVARSVETFRQDLSSLGHRVLVICPNYEKDARPGLDPGGVLRLPAIQGFNGSSFSLGLPAPLVVQDVVRSFAPDIFHAHHPYLLGDTALRLARLRGAPLVFTHHTLYENYTHYVWPDSEPARRFVMRLASSYANLADRVVAPSRSVASLIAQRGVRRPVSVLPTGVDTQFFARGDGLGMRRKLGLDPAWPVIGHLGRLAREKNLAYLARAVAAALTASKEARFLVVGQGPSETEIRSILEEKGLKERLVMAGARSGQELADCYKAMDIFAFSSLSETQGLVLAEAMAAGRPVVALDGPGVREVVRDGENGRLLEQKTSAPEFGKVLARVLEDQDLMGRFSQAALETSRLFGRLAAAEKLAALYEELIAKRPCREGRPEGLEPWSALIDRVSVEFALANDKVAAAYRALAGVPPKS